VVVAAPVHEELPAFEVQDARNRPAETVRPSPLVVPKVREYHSVASTITAIPGEAPPLQVAAPESPAASRRAHLREMLRTRESLRSAFVLREILGPPPGLQR
jgi:hypothetical protein